MKSSKKTVNCGKVTKRIKNEISNNMKITSMLKSAKKSSPVSHAFKSDTFSHFSPTFHQNLKENVNQNILDDVKQKPKLTKIKSTEERLRQSSRNTSITDYYSVRRSSRRCEKQIKEEEYNKIIQKIIENEEEGLEVKEFPLKGRGVISTKNFARNEFIVEYAGDLINLKEAKRREEIYALDKDAGCYMYYFNSRGKNFCIDATSESGRLGRLLNHSRSNPNCYTKVTWFHNQLKSINEDLPHLTILARRDISAGEELTYDYGDREKKSLIAHPWLKC